MGVEWRPVNKTDGSTATLGSPTDTRREAHSYQPVTTRETEHDRTAPPRWHEPSVQPRAGKIYVSSQDVRQLIASALGTRLAEDFRLFLGDNLYYLPPLRDTEEIIRNSGLARATYMPESFDCDDFAIVLKAHFCEAAYKDFERRAPHCLGLIWGELPHVHAINWMINDDYRLRLIEPQTGEVFEPRADSRNITFMMA